MSGLSSYDGRRPEPPYKTPSDEALSEALEMLREVASDYFRMRLAFGPEDSRRARCEELTDKVLEFIGSHE